MGSLNLQKQNFARKSLTKYIFVAVSVAAVLEWLRFRLRRTTMNLAYFEIKFDPV